MSVAVHDHRAENRLREHIAVLGRSIFERGLTAGSSGNISVRLDDGWLLTPTNASLGSLDPARIAKLDWTGALIDGDPPSKEAFLHRAMYEERSGAGAIVHLHSTHSAAVSCMAGLDPANCIPPLTAYYVMKIGRLPLIPYFRPGDPALADAIRGLASQAPRGPAGEPRSGRLRQLAGGGGLRHRRTRGNGQAVPAVAQLGGAAAERRADRRAEGSVQSRLLRPQLRVSRHAEVRRQPDDDVQRSAVSAALRGGGGGRLRRRSSSCSPTIIRRRRWRDG